MCARAMVLPPAGGKVNKSGERWALMSVTRSIKEALQSPEPFGPLLKIAQRQAEQGMPQAVLYAVFQHELALHRDEEALSAALEDVLDLIHGWCTPDRRLYP